MWFTTYVLKNLSRRPMRSLLTIFAIALAIGSVIALVGIATSFERTFLKTYKSADIDMIVVRAGTGRHRMNSTLDVKLSDKIRQVPGVKEVLYSLTDQVSFEEMGLYTVPIQGFEPETAVFNHIKTIEGRPLKKGDTTVIMLGTFLAKKMDKKIGDTVDVLEKKPYTVVGIFEANNGLENNAIIIPL